MFATLALFLNAEWMSTLNMTNKLTREQAEEVCIELREGVSRAKIAEMFGISRALVDQINYGKSYPIYQMRYPIVKFRSKSIEAEEYPLEDSYTCNAYQPMN